MRVLIRCWHTPYIYMLARALPDVEFDVLDTRHAPEGWRDDQRPRPENVRVVGEPGEADVLVLQTAEDMVAAADRNWHGGLLFLAHNHATLEPEGVVSALDRQRVPLVTISEMKAASWRDAGYTGQITVIRPYAPEGMPEWEGDQNYVLTVANGLHRPLFDYDRWRKVARGLERVCAVKLVGENNEGKVGAMGPAYSWQELQEEYRHCAAYVNPTVPPYEDYWNLAMLEAQACGCPVVNLHGTDDEDEDILVLSLALLASGDIPHQPQVTRAWVAREFPKDAFVSSWKKVLEEATRGE